jgi:hypothetical protein
VVPVLTATSLFEKYSTDVCPKAGALATLSERISDIFKATSFGKT